MNIDKCNININININTPMNTHVYIVMKIYAHRQSSGHGSARITGFLKPTEVELELPRFRRWQHIREFGHGMVQVIDQPTVAG